MWGPLLEKSWAKVKGAYENAEGGFLKTGLRMLTGAPSFYYDDLSDARDMFNLVKEADLAGFLVGAGTSGGGNDQIRNECGIAQSHAYSIYGTFTMTDESNQDYDMMIIRNPWGETGYTGDWNY